jgi:hypothetical protein
MTHMLLIHSKKMCRIFDPKFMNVIHVYSLFMTMFPYIFINCNVYTEVKHYVATLIDQVLRLRDQIFKRIVVTILSFTDISVACSNIFNCNYIRISYQILAINYMTPMYTYFSHHII